MTLREGWTLKYSYSGSNPLGSGNGFDGLTLESSTNGITIGIVSWSTVTSDNVGRVFAASKGGGEWRSPSELQRV